VDTILTYINYAPVACAIFAVTLIVSLLAFSSDDLYGKFILHPYSLTRGDGWYTVITSGLIHRDWGHLFFNMMSYYFFAFTLETYLGHWQFGLLYVVSLVLSDLPTIAKHKDDYWYRSLGASGAISAVIFSYIMFNPMARMGIMFIPIPIPAILFGALYLVYCVYASKRSQDNINHDAHFYGALSGVGLTIILNHNVIKLFFYHLINLS
jgi:membrane associated rhomboid family serine protease